MVVEVYDAFRSAGADEDKSRKAAEVLVRDERFDKMDKRLGDLDMRLSRVEARLDMVTWMLGIVLTMNGGVLVGVFLLFTRSMMSGN